MTLSKSYLHATKIENKTHAISSNHYHPYYELLYVVSGEFRYFVNDTALRVVANNVILVKKNFIHKALFEQDTPCTFYFLNFPENIIAPEHHGILEELFNTYQLDFKNDNFMTGMLFSKICKEFNKTQIYWEENIRYQLNELIITLYRASLFHNKMLEITSSTIEKAISFINQCIKKEEASLISLEAVSQHCHLSPTSFSKKFKRETGINFKTYVVTAHVLYAQELIDTTDLPITEIAFRCGFPDSNYFSTVFKRITQLSPSQYASYSRKRNMK